MRCSWFHVDWPWRTSSKRAGDGLSRGVTALPASGCSGRANLISISILTFSLIPRSGWADLRRSLLQSHGSLAETPLRSLLESAQGERSTGTLVVRNGNGQSTSLYFLFGHLFHAQGEGRSGDDAVVSALNWTKGDFEFDAKAKLPADETVKAGIPELVHAAETTPKPAPPEPKAEPKLERAEPRNERREHAEAERKVEAPQPRRGVKHRPSPKHGRARRARRRRPFAGADRRSLRADRFASDVHGAVRGVGRHEGSPEFLERAEVERQRDDPLGRRHRRHHPRRRRARGRLHERIA